MENSDQQPDGIPVPQVRPTAQLLSDELRHVWESRLGSVGLSLPNIFSESGSLHLVLGAHFPFMHNSVLRKSPRFPVQRTPNLPLPR